MSQPTLSLEHGLRNLGLQRASATPESISLFMAFAELIYHNKSFDSKVKQMLLHYLQSHEEEYRHQIENLTNGSFQSYYERISNPSFEGGDFELRILATIYSVCAKVCSISPLGELKCDEINQNHPNKVALLRCSPTQYEPLMVIQNQTEKHEPETSNGLQGEDLSEVFASLNMLGGNSLQERRQKFVSDLALGSNGHNSALNSQSSSKPFQFSNDHFASIAAEMFGSDPTHRKLDSAKLLTGQTEPTASGFKFSVQKNSLEDGFHTEPSGDQFRRKFRSQTHRADAGQFASTGSSEFLTSPYRSVNNDFSISNFPIGNSSSKQKEQYFFTDSKFSVPEVNEDSSPYLGGTPGSANQGVKGGVDGHFFNLNEKTDFGGEEQGNEKFVNDAFNAKLFNSTGSKPQGFQHNFMDGVGLTGQRNIMNQNGFSCPKKTSDAFTFNTPSTKTSSADTAPNDSNPSYAQDSAFVSNTQLYSQMMYNGSSGGNGHSGPQMGESDMFNYSLNSGVSTTSSSQGGGVGYGNGSELDSATSLESEFKTNRAYRKTGSTGGLANAGGLTSFKNKDIDRIKPFQPKGIYTGKQGAMSDPEATQYMNMAAMMANNSPEKNNTLKTKNFTPEDKSDRRYYGSLKFFDENNNYGFLVLEEDGSDVFVHFDDLKKSDIPKSFLKMKNKMIRFSFTLMTYLGKKKRSRKAVDLKLENVVDRAELMFPMNTEAYAMGY